MDDATQAMSYYTDNVCEECFADVDGLCQPECMRMHCQVMTLERMWYMKPYQQVGYGEKGGS